MEWNQCNRYFVKEHVGLFKAANNFDLYDPDGQMILKCREEKLGLLTKLFRFTDYKRMTPFDIQIRDANDRLLIEVKRGISIFLSRVKVYDEEGAYIGGFKQKLFSIGGKFNVLDPHDQVMCMLKGKWTGWDFQFIHDGMELARVTKKWAGLGKELLTSADNYVLEISDEIEPNDNMRKLIIAAVMCIDMVLKE
jgi:uncharacterized protein YxjI